MRHRRLRTAIQVPRGRSATKERGGKAGHRRCPHSTQHVRRSRTMTYLARSSPLYQTDAPAVGGKRRSKWIATSALLPLALFGWAAASEAGITAIRIDSRAPAFG